MNPLCRIGWHQWRKERLLEQTLSSGLKCTLDGDVCLRCEKIRDPQNMADVRRLLGTGPTSGAPIVEFGDKMRAKGFAEAPSMRARKTMPDRQD